MIKINRLNCPPLLAKGGDVDEPKCHQEVVNKLHKMQYGKCCYCEKKIEKVGAEQAIEHYRPQGPKLFPQLKNEWTNLLHVCANCNGKKRSKFFEDANGIPLFINPSDPSVNPEEYFDFVVDDEDIELGRIKPKENSDPTKTSVAETTIKEIGLDLVDRRRERSSILIDLFKAYMEIKLAEDDTTKAQKIRAFEAKLYANNSYAAFARAFARRKLEKLEQNSKISIKVPQGAEIAT